jgi:predicted permease
MMGPFSPSLFDQAAVTQRRRHRACEQFVCDGGAVILELLSVVAPVFVVALLGLAWARSGRQFDEVSISRLVLNVGIPCLVFHSLTSLDVPPAELARMAGLAAALMSIFAVGGLLALKAMKLPANTYLGPLVFANSGDITIGVVASDATVPTWIARTTTLLGDIAIPLMLLTLGVSLSKMHPESLGRSIILSLVRLGLGQSAY